MKVRSGFAALVAAGALVAGGLTATTAAQAASVQCDVHYTVQNDWGAGFTTQITIDNLGSTLDGWTLTYSYSGNQHLSNGWSGDWSQSGQDVTVANKSWNAAIASGGSTVIGANFAYTGSNDDPTAFSINGTPCSGATPPTTTPPTTTPPTTPPPDQGPAPALQVSGNKLVDASGDTVVLHGVNRSGGEFACVQGNGIWNGPMDQASVDAIKSWHVDVVRVPLNEACWNGESYVDAQYSGATYRQAVQDYVDLLNASGIVAIVELHWSDGQYTGPSSGCSDAHATCQKPMPDAAQSIPFWTSMAQTFGGNDSVIFDLFNEPYPERATGSETTGWQCWRDGGTCSGIAYQVAGMQDLVDAVRSTGADNVIMLGGLAYSNDETQWLQYAPNDPDGNLVASWHSYNFNVCASSSCWNSQLAPVMEQVPFVAGEIGENDCAHGYIDTLMAWLDQHHASYLAWTWNNWNCSSGPSLISDYDGTPTAYGIGYKNHMAALH